MSDIDLLTTPLHAMHRELGAKMVAFAGYSMPVSYPQGIIAEHRHCRSSAALFDVSHMGQIRLIGEDAAKALETLVPSDVLDLEAGKQRYSCFTNSNGGILDDLMITRRVDDLLLVVNAACKVSDIRHLVTHIGHRCAVQPMLQHALLALQGPSAQLVLGRLNAAIDGLVFMSGMTVELLGSTCHVTRSGYTGEDGFEISVPADRVVELARALLAMPEVKPAGLGARDTLRMEAGMCLYGHEIDAGTTPIEAGLGWTIPNTRRPGGARPGGYPGADALAAQIARGTAVKRVGLLGLERVPVREGAPLHDAQGHRLGKVTSGTLGPSVNRPIAMAYVAANHASPGHELYADVRGKAQPMRVTPLPFSPHRYFRG
ncbi:MAG: glycine cleavage system aminomethyltransferase GcvT [Burkholderiaceae bacterium]